MSVFSLEQWRTRWKTEVWIEDTLHLGDQECSFFKGGENKIRREKATGKERKEGELNVTENNERQRTKGKKLIGTNREWETANLSVNPQNEFKLEARVFLRNCFPSFPCSLLLDVCQTAQLVKSHQQGISETCRVVMGGKRKRKKNRSADCLLASRSRFYCVASFTLSPACACESGYVCSSCLMRSRWEIGLLAGPVIASHCFGCCFASCLRRKRCFTGINSYLVSCMHALSVYSCIFTYRCINGVFQACMCVCKHMCSRCHFSRVSWQAKKSLSISEAVTRLSAWYTVNSAEQTIILHHLQSTMRTEKWEIWNKQTFSLNPSVLTFLLVCRCGYHVVSAKYMFGLCTCAAVFLLICLYI